MQTPSVLVAGESLIDLIVDVDGRVDAALGGGPFNVARGVARLETSSAFAGALSEDAFGMRLREALWADGVDLRRTVATERPTTLAVAQLGAEGAEYRFYTAGTAAPELPAADAPAGLRALHVGSLGLVLEPLATAVEQLVATADAQTLVMVDPNWRPAAIADEDAVRARLWRVLTRADVVKVSTEDLGHLFPGVDRGEAALRLLARCGGSVLVTDGGRPARASTTRGEFEVPVPEVPVVDTVGAGDAFCAAFLSWWDRHGHGRHEARNPAALRPAVEFAVRAAAVACTRRGAEPPRSWEL